MEPVKVAWSFDHALARLEPTLGERNAAIFRYRAMLYHETMIEALEANLAWHGRMWRTPDVAPCLGRYTKPERKR